LEHSHGDRPGRSFGKKNIDPWVGEPVLIEIYSDVVCPWCYIGKRRFEAALAEFEDADDVEVVWKPYQLDPTAPRQPGPVLDALAAKFGGLDQARAAMDQVTAVAATVGLEYRMDLAQRSNTLDAHRVLWLAEQTGAQDAVKERLLRAYFTEGVDVGSHDELVRLATEAGLDADSVRSLLAGEDGIGEVREEMAEGVARGVRAVPTFIFERTWAVSGAQEPEALLGALRQVRDELAKANRAD
jgi:predicted DsbA family dithiol-disulfide isomerase